MLAIWRVWKSSKHCSGVNDMAEHHEKALVPQIRFTGFTDPWEQRKLGELCDQRIETAMNPLRRFRMKKFTDQYPAVDRQSNWILRTVTCGISMNSLTPDCLYRQLVYYVNQIECEANEDYGMYLHKANAVCSSQFMPVFFCIAGSDHAVSLRYHYCQSE